MTTFAQLITRDPETLNLILNLRCAISQTVLARGHCPPSPDAIIEVTEHIAELFDFEPSIGQVQVFIALHPALQAMIVVHGAGDTEVREKTAELMVQFTLGVSFEDANNKLKELVATQWKRIWSSS